MSDAVPINDPSSIPFRIHPRVFAALGFDLVTNDIVSIIEMAKNSYDAYATTVDIRIRVTGDPKTDCIEVEDTGYGMTRSVIENVWCEVATPYKVGERMSARGKRSRRVSGEKGLGRLSAARLGDRLELITKSDNEPCWYVVIEWDKLVTATTLDACKVTVIPCPSELARQESGTLIRIRALKSEWSPAKVADLHDQLSRLLSPFENTDDFEIRLATPGDEEGKSVTVEPPKFLQDPPYTLKGQVNRQGRLTAEYRYKTPSQNRSQSVVSQLWEADKKPVQEQLWPEQPNGEIPCGPFEFEFRVWDIDKDSIEDIANRFSINKSTIRRDIQNYYGISLYRDKILVLPKSRLGRDWVGLDLRRISKVGERLSTSQIVGYVAITAQGNPKIRDTSDRERLEDNAATRKFIDILVDIVSILENERGRDREDTAKTDPPLKELFGDLSPDDLVERVNEAVVQGADAATVQTLVSEYADKYQQNVDQIEQRLVYYSRLASIGVLASLIMHEVRNHTQNIGRLARKVRALLEVGDPVARTLERDLKLAESGIHALERVAERFAPLASRNFRSGRRNTVLLDAVRDCVVMRETEIAAQGTTVEIDIPAEIVVAVDPGELTSILINLIDNALYWVSSVKDRPRQLRFVGRLQTNQSRVNVQVDDSGPGVPPSDEKRIFRPGVTSKPNGLGMGLTVAAELVAQYRGKMALVIPGSLGGASFGFDLPVPTRKV